MKVLIKIGGTLLDAPETRHRLAREITAFSAHNEVVVVHGGGKQMTRYLTEHGIESRFVNGLRVTTPEVLDAVLKIFAGTVNSQLVSSFRAAGAMPVGLTGLDAGLVDAEPLNPELQHVGKPIQSDTRLIDILIRERYLPVVACIAGDTTGAVYNVNGDQMAAACASSFRADQLIFLTDVDGVRDSGGAIRATLPVFDAVQLIHSGVATGGMQAKLEAAMSAIRAGVANVLIGPGSYVNILQSPTMGSRIIP